MRSPFRLQSTLCTWPCIALCLLALMLVVGAQSASAQVTGSIFTTTKSGTQVNANIFDSKDAVYVNGGPQNEHANGLSPDGTYYFQVTDPSGAVLLSTDDVTCRQLVVSGGKIVGVPSGTPPASCTEPAGSATPGAFHNVGPGDGVSGETPVQLCAQSGCPAGQPDYKDTPNAGGEYKVWITPVTDYVGVGGACPTGSNNFGFCTALSDTDNFKVRSANLALIAVCKFNDENDNGTQDNGEPLIPHWPITATGVVGGPVVTQTDDSGCVSFSVNTFPNNGTATVTLTEGTLGPDWTQTAPASGACTLTGSQVNGADTCNVSAGVITLTVSPGDALNAPNFGNFNPNCTTGCNGQQILVTKTANPVVSYKWTIQKSVDKSSIDTSGSATANYTVTVTHDGGTATMTGNIKVSNPFGPDVSGITVTDSVSDANTDGGSCTVTTPAAVTAPDGTITVAAGTHVDATYSCTFTDVPAAGSNTNTATATWNSPASPVTGQAPFDFGTATLVDNSVTVTDTLAGNLGSVTIDNTGATTCTPDSSGSPANRSNPVVCSVSGAIATFTYSLTFNDPAGTCTTHNNTATFTTNTNGTAGSDNKSVQVCVGADLTVAKTAATSFTRTYNWTISKSANPTTIDAPSGTTGTSNYTVIASETGFVDSGWQVAGNITVSNPNDWEDITANLSDAITGANCIVNGGTTSVLVNRGSSVTVPYTCTLSAAPSPSKGTNTAGATWDKTAAFTPDGSAQGTAGYDFGSATITRVNQTITPTDAFNGGSAVNLCTLAASTPCTLTATDPPAALTTQTYTYSRSLNVPTATCTTYPNTASTGLTGTGQTANASVQVCGASDLTVTKTATPAFNSNITKAVDNTRINTTSGGSATFNYTVTVTESGWNVTGTITVTNPNNWEAITASVADALPSASCSVSPNSSQSVPASGSANWTYTCNFSAAPSASGTNTATASWDATAAHTADSSASGSQGYTFGTLHVTDSFAGALGTISAPAASTVFTYSRTITAPTASCGTFPNTATITETSQSSSKSVEVCGFSPLTVSKTAATTYNANIKKTAGQTSPVEGGSSTTLTYTITVTESGWQVTGNIMVNNPNNWEPVTVSLSDALSIGGSCSIAGGTTQTVPASSSISPGYTCTFASAPAASGTNTAMASWSGSGSSSGTTFVVAGSASSTVGFAFQLLNVTDQFNGGTTKTLGSNLVPAASYSFNDSYTVTVAAGTCTSFPNVATLAAVGTPPNASVTLGPPAQVTVTVCDTGTGALTMGFWKNNNGQGIISKFCGGTGGLTLVQFLAGNGSTWPGFNPFKDDTATTCKAEATYVNSIISGASCTSTTNTCNSMLRAQMLATALDVYFSDPTLGGNQIGGFNNLGNKTPALGGVAIDLSHICDGGDGGFGGGCPEDARRVFGICTGNNTPVAGCTAGVLGTTVLKMLLYSDFASSINGNPVATPNTGAKWYNQTKGLQVVAKDSFDSINNQIAPIAPSGVGTPSF